MVLIHTSLQNIVYMNVRYHSVTEGGPRMLVYTNLEIAVVVGRGGGSCIHGLIKSVSWSMRGISVMS